MIIVGGVWDAPGPYQERTGRQIFFSFSLLIISLKTTRKN
jgi:hypothetical protein